MDGLDNPLRPEIICHPSTDISPPLSLKKGLIAFFFTLKLFKILIHLDQMCQINWDGAAENFEFSLEVCSGVQFKLPQRSELRLILHNESSVGH